MSHTDPHPPIRQNGGYLSHAHSPTTTYTYRPTHTLSLSHAPILTHSRTDKEHRDGEHSAVVQGSLSRSLTHSNALTRTHSPARTHTHALTRTHSHARAHTHAFTHTHALTCTHSHARVRVYLDLSYVT